MLFMQKIQISPDTNPRDKQTQLSQWPASPDGPQSEHSSATIKLTLVQEEDRIKLIVNILNAPMDMCLL